MNLRPFAPKANALPDCATPRCSKFIPRIITALPSRLYRTILNHPSVQVIKKMGDSLPVKNPPTNTLINLFYLNFCNTLLALLSGFFNYMDHLYKDFLPATSLKKTLLPKTGRNTNDHNIKPESLCPTNPLYR